MVAQTPLEYGLPAPSWWAYQKETVEALIAAFDRSRYVMLKAPTGAGKTILAAALSKEMDWRSVYLTETINLQGQYLRTLSGAKTATGRRNHQCDLMVGSITAEDGPCPCPLAEEEGTACSYYRQWYACEEANDVVLNYPYAVRVMKAQGLRVGHDEEFGRSITLPNPFKARSLMVCDEGHLLEKALLAATGVEVRAQTLSSCDLQAPENPSSLRSWKTWASVVGMGVKGRMMSARSLLQSYAEHGTVPKAVGAGVRRWSTMNSVVEQIRGLGDDCMVFRTGAGWHIRPLWVARSAEKALFRYADRVLIMSATLGDTGLLARILGIDEVETVEMPSTFPVENRKVFYWPVMRMNASTPKDDRMKQVAALNHIANLGDFKGTKGVVHCASYALAQELYNNAPQDVRSRMIVHEPTTREDAFKEFLNASSPAILVSPSAMTGVDWPYQVRWQMLPKMPFGDLGDDFTRARFEYVDETGHALGKEVYANETGNMTVQACGRCTRAADDTGTTVITDSNFWPNFRHTAKGAYPDWFKEAVVRYRGG